VRQLLYGEKGNLARCDGICTQRRQRNGGSASGWPSVPKTLLIKPRRLRVKPKGTTMAWNHSSRSLRRGRLWPALLALRQRMSMWRRERNPFYNIA